MVFSEETEPPNGDPYYTILVDLTADPTMNAQALADTTALRYNEFYGTGINAEAATKSAVNMEYIDQLHTKLTELADAFINDSTDISAVISNAQENSQEYYLAYYHDIYDFCVHLENNSTNHDVTDSLCPEIRSIINTMVTINTFTSADVADSHGLSIYLPTAEEISSPVLDHYNQLACNRSQGAVGSTWGAFVEQYVRWTGWVP